jgi:DNA replication protein DnaC
MTAAASVASPAAPQVLLAHHLRQLKLPTFLREYEKVASEAAREGLDHVRFLLRLAELELIDCEKRMVQRRIRAAHFSAVTSFDTFDFAAIPSRAGRTVRDQPEDCRQVEEAGLCQRCPDGAEGCALDGSDEGRRSCRCRFP